MKRVRRSTFFEKAILIVGLGIALLGFFLFTTHPEVVIEQWQLIIIVLVWLMLLTLIILMAIGEDIKEEISEIIKEELEQLHVLKGIAHDQLTEIRLLNELTIADKKNLPPGTLHKVARFKKRQRESEEMQERILGKK
ncbi:MAG: hypothetical protein KJ709_06680 [Nanoarchaeota archaeon]|nr:hypothetical protein [Nanoarchaeota archaeon]